MTNLEFAAKLARAAQAQNSSLIKMFVAELIHNISRSSALIPRERVLDAYLATKEQLQMIGCRCSTESVEHDQPLWDELTRTLALVRAILVTEYGLDLPQPRVVSPVTEAIEAGELTAVVGENGETLVVPCTADPYTIRIRITKVPDGPAPEEHRKLWVGMELPARRGIPCYDIEDAPHPRAETYIVPLNRATTLLREKSELAANWFAENFRSGNLMFGADEAELVS